MITLTGVEMSPDLALAKVFFTTLGDAESLTRTEEGLTRAAGFLRAQLAGRLKLRIAPEFAVPSRRFGRARRAPCPS